MVNNFAEIEQMLQGLAASNAKLGSSVSNIEKQISQESIDQALQGLARKPIGGQDLQEIQGIQQDPLIRSLRGFLDPKKGQTVVAAILKKKFPDRNIQVVDLDGRLAFSLDGQNFSSLDPQDGDLLGETAEQIGRFVEPAAEIASAFSPAGPIAGPALVAGGSQVIREGIEAAAGDDQKVSGRLSDIALKSGGAALAGRIGEGIGKGISGLFGKGARATVRASGDVNKAVQQGSELLQEKATRQIEKSIIKGSNPEKFAGFLQRRAEKFVNKLTGEANQAFQAGRKLAEKEGLNPKNTISLVDEVTGAIDNISASESVTQGFKKELTGQLAASAKKVGKEVAEDGSIDLANLSSRELIDLREFLVGYAGKVTNATDVNKNAVIGLKTVINDALEQQAKAGSKAAAQYAKGISRIKELNEKFPEQLQKKVIGKSFEFPSQFDKVTPGELLKKLGGETFDSLELAKLKELTGIGGRKSAEKLATKNLLSDFIVKKGGVRSRTNIRPQDLPPEALQKAELFSNVSGLDQAQKRGLKVSGDEFLDLVGPGNKANIPQPEFNFRPVAEGITKRSGGLLGAEGFGTGEGLAASQLGERQAFDSAVDLINKASDLQLAAQGQTTLFGSEPTAFIGRNTLKAAADVPVLNKVVSLLGGDDIGKNIFQATGRVPDFIPEALETAGKAGAGELAVIQNLLGGKPDLSSVELEEELQAQLGPAAKFLRGGVTFTEGRDKR